MIRQIPCDQIAIGMYVQGFGGSWLDHPFWRAKFLLETSEQVAKVRGSAVPYVVIDDSKGVGVAQDPPITAAQYGDMIANAVENARRAGSEANLAAYRGAPLAEARRDDHRERAVRLVARSRKTMKSVFENARLGRAVRMPEIAPIVDELNEAIARNAQTLLSVIRLKAQDGYTYFHSVAVCVLMVNVARHLDMDDADVREMGMAGLLHDIGKMGVADEILNKPGSLSEAEFEAVRGHPAYGHALLMQTPDMAPMALDVCLHHHEKIDGTGYPFAKPGEDISRAARLGAICDVYDALTSDRVYKAGWSPVDAITAMWSWEGHFDRDLLFAFMQSIGVFPEGMLVRLSSNRLGMVMENRRRASRPRACAFFATRTLEYLPPETVVIKDDFSGDRIVAPEDPAHWGFSDWEGMCALLQQGRDPSALQPLPKAAHGG